jgi:hypothetical protein
MQRENLHQWDDDDEAEHMSSIEERWHSRIVIQDLPTSDGVRWWTRNAGSSCSSRACASSLLTACGGEDEHLELNQILNVDID